MRFKDAGPCSPPARFDGPTGARLAYGSGAIHQPISTPKMTLVALTMNTAYPVLMGDILMTSSEKEYDIDIPTLLKEADQFFSSDQKLFPAGFKQKIYIVADKIAIGFAGDEFQITVFLDDLRNYFKYHDVNAENLNHFLAQTGYDDIQSVSMVGVLAEKRPEGVLLHPFNKGIVSHVTSPSFGYIMACGSGSDSLIKRAVTEMDYYNSSPSDVGFTLEEALARNLSLVSLLLVNEHFTIDSLKEAWGAGFEIVYYNGEKFVKLDDITFIYGALSLIFLLVNM